jgi:ABC-type lipoprotein export system ATPase subunit
VTIQRDGDIVLHAQALEKSFGAGSGRRQVLGGVDLSVARGEIVAVAGRSGSG